MSGSQAPASDTWSMVVGQDEAVERLRASATSPVHAYMFVGPPGTGKRDALLAFAAELFAAGAADDYEADRHRRLALASHHPDLVIVEPEGAQFRGGREGADGVETEAARVIRETSRSPVEVRRKVVALIDFHLANESAIGSLLKTLEEPPDTAILVLLNEHVPTEQSAVASRCVQIEFRPIPPQTMIEALEGEGVEPDRARQAVALAGGDLTRARVLATDERLALRVDAWRAVPTRLDGTGARVAALVADLRAMIDDAAGPLIEAHAQEVVRFDEEAEMYGMRGVTGRKRSLTDRHKRIERRFRLDELRLGLATLAAVYRDAAASADEPAPMVAAAHDIHATVEALTVNPNEALALQALLLRLPALATRS